MDIQMFLREDIVAFLESRLSVDYLKEQSKEPMRQEEFSAVFTRNYEEELFTALRKKDVAGAKQILHEVRDDFSSHPVGSPERHHAQLLLHSLYEKFKEFLEDDTAFEKFENALDTMNGMVPRVNASPDAQSSIAQSNTAQADSTLLGPSSANSAVPLTSAQNMAQFSAELDKRPGAASFNESPPSASTAQMGTSPISSPSSSLPTSSSSSSSSASSPYSSPATASTGASSSTDPSLSKVVPSDFAKNTAQEAVTSEQARSRNALLDGAPVATTNESPRADATSDSLTHFVSLLSALNAAIDIQDVREARAAYARLKKSFSSLSPADKRTQFSLVQVHFKHLQALIAQEHQKTHSAQGHTPSSEHKKDQAGSKGESSAQSLAVENSHSSLPTTASGQNTQTTPATTTPSVLSAHEARVNAAAQVESSTQESSLPLPQSIVDKERAMLKSIKLGDIHQAMLTYETIRTAAAGLPIAQKRLCVARLHKYHGLIMHVWKGEVARTVRVVNTIKEKGEAHIPTSILRKEREIIAAMKAGDVPQAMMAYERVRSEVLHGSIELRALYASRLHKYHQCIFKAAARISHAPKAAVYDATIPEQGSTILTGHEKRLSGKP